MEDETTNNPPLQDMERKSGRRHGKDVVVEPDNYDNPIEVNYEPSDDDFVDMGGSSSYCSGLRRNGRNKDKAVAGAGHDKSVASGLFVIRIMETYMGKGVRNWDVRLDASGGNIKKQLVVLSKKYAASILLSDCNLLKAKK
ncbi:hypothetical protein Tco_1027121 [Tanacetum coccineum]